MPLFLWCFSKNGGRAPPSSEVAGAAEAADDEQEDRDEQGGRETEAADDVQGATSKFIELKHANDRARGITTWLTGYMGAARAPGGAAVPRQDPDDRDPEV